MDDERDETLTFLLSDIEGSTRRWDRDDDAMARALERHDELLREVFEVHGGRWVKHTGDGVLAAFPSALGAISAAVEAQRTIAGEDWNDVGGLAARMALHTGEARSRDGDYFGQALNRTARLLDAAHGGQVLTSLATEELARDRLPSGVELCDLGTHALADLTRPEHVFQVVAGGLQHEFPSLRGTTVPHNLPTFRTSFVGRDADVASLSEALDRHRLVTLTGVGGTGKTRLAVEVAKVRAERSPGGVHFVDLASITDGDLVARQTAQAVGVVAGGVAGPSTATIDEQLLRALADDHVLLLVDNCEHLLDATADHVDTLLTECPNVRVLATSREALGIEGEQTWPVASLTLPTSEHDDTASMQLLLDRVRELRPDFTVEEPDRAALVEICRRLDGLPLALELAAARLAHLSPQDVADRLGDRFRLLSGGRRRTERQQTLRAAIDWSYDLLDEAERVLLRRLSVFAGGAPVEAVEAIAMTGLDGELAIDLLGRLTARSLVVADTGGGTTRYRLLETIRLYGEDKLVDAGEAHETRVAHRDWYLGWLDAFPWDLRLISPEVAARLQPEFDNFRLALEWSDAAGEPDLVARLVCGLAGFGILNGYADELDRWIAIARSRGLTERVAAELDAHHSYLDTWRYNGDPASFDAVRATAASAFEHLPESHPYRALARCCYGATHTVTHPKEPWRIEEPASEAVALALDHDAPWMAIIAKGFVARARLYLRDAEGAVATLEEAMSIDAWDEAHDGLFLRHDLAVALHLLDRQDEALHNALAVANGGAATWRHVGQLDASVISAATGDPGAGRDHIRRALGRLEELRWHHPLAVIDCATMLGAIATYEERWEDAARILATNGGNSSHPAFYAIWTHYRDRIKDALPIDVRRRCIEEGQAMSVEQVIAEELAREPS